MGVPRPQHEPEEEEEQELLDAALIGASDPEYAECARAAGRSASWCRSVAVTVRACATDWLTDREAAVLPPAPCNASRLNFGTVPAVHGRPAAEAPGHRGHGRSGQPVRLRPPHGE